MMSRIAAQGYDLAMWIEIAKPCKPVITPLNQLLTKFGCFALIVGLLLVFVIFMIGLTQLTRWFGW